MRKLLTQKQKTTDFWSRDAALQPVLKKGLLSSLGGALGRLAWGDSSPRGKLSAPGTPAASGGDSSPAPTPMAGFLAGDAPAGGAGGAGAGRPRPVHVDNPQQAKEDIVVWSDCVVYEMKKCVAPALVLPGLAFGRCGAAACPPAPFAFPIIPSP